MLSTVKEKDTVLGEHIRKALYLEEGGEMY
jgi:hypothetical protein